MLLLISLLGLTAPDADARVRTLVVDSKLRSEPVQLRVSATTTTSIKLNRPITKLSVTLGLPDDFFVEVLEAQGQINLKAKSAKLAQGTNLNIVTKTGEFIGLDLITTDAKKADLFLSLEFSGAAAQVTKREGEANDGPCSADCEEKIQTDLLRGAADVLATRSVDERAVHWDVIFKVLTFVKIGNRGFVRFEVENRSRDSWVGGEVKLSFAAPGREAKSVDVTHFFKQTVVERGASTSGAISFDMYDLPENARFTIQAFEKNGTRHPEVKNVRL